MGAVVSRCIPVKIFFEQRKFVSGAIYGVVLAASIGTSLIVFILGVDDLLREKSYSEPMEHFLSAAAFLAYYFTARRIPKNHPNVLSVAGVVSLFPVFFLAYLHANQYFQVLLGGAKEDGAPAIALTVAIIVSVPTFLVLHYAGKRWAMKWKL